MRKNVKKQLALRVLSTAALMAMVSSIATAAFAEEYDLNKGSVTVETKDNGNTYVTQANTETTDHLDTTGVTITSNGEQTSNTITVNTADNQTTNVTLQDVNIKEDQWSGGAAMTINGKGDTEIELNGDNTLISGNYHAGLEKAGDVSQGSLTIKDDKNNDGSEKAKDEDGDIGTLIAAGGYDGAGIGGRKNKEGEDYRICTSTSDITITGGKIKAGSLNETKKEYPQTEQGGAGIGGASDYGNATNITITGNADVSAAGGYYAAGIGGGEYGDATNITISGNAKVTAAGSNSGGAGIGGGDYGTGSVLITDHADVTAYGGNQGAGIGGGASCGGSVEISGNAKVTAVGANGSAGIGSGDHNAWVKPDRADTKVTISENADVTAVGSYEGAAIGNGAYCSQGKTTINITGGTVTAIGGKELTSAIGGSQYDDSTDKVQDITVNINGTTGNTTVNASCWGDQKSAISTGNGAADIIGYDKDGKSPFGEDGSVIVRMYNHGSYTKGHGSVSKYDGDLKSYNLGDLYQVVHNRKYMKEHPEIVDDFNKLENSDLHDWQLVGEVVEPTLEEDGYADYVCRIDKCGQTKRVVLPKLTPEESGSVETREVGVIFWDAAAQTAPAALQGKVLSADEKTATAAKAQVESLLADKANWKLAEDVGDLMIHPAADAAGTVYEQAVKASGCQYYVIANVTAQ
ncbi:MAG: hypothetical protein UC771_07695 [Faecalibacterium sp.]|nr:hypothetical protein [Faecalibacterium sp.]